MDFKRICLRCMDGEIRSNGICSACGKVPLTEQSPSCALPLQYILHGRYLIGGVLGQGGFGITYAAYDFAENRRVVIKELFPSFMVRRVPGTEKVIAYRDQDFFTKCRQRFVEEAQLIYSFHNTPEIVDVFHIFIENNTGYYSMEFLAGQTLQSFLRTSGGKLTWVQLTPIVKDVICALRVLHQHGSIHRDISPDNIYLSVSGKAKLIDFGAARNYHSTRSMTQILKKGFAPWEQYHSCGSFGPWTDIYAFAATLYFCLTGQMVPEAPARAKHDTLQRPTEVGANIPPYVEDALMRALRVRPEQRIQNVDAFADALRLDFPNVPTTQADNVKHVVSGQQNAAHVHNPMSVGKWQLRGIRGEYAGMQIPFASNIIIGRDPKKCTLVYPPNVPGISRMHLTLLFGVGPSFPGIRCESDSQGIYINGTMFSGHGRIGKLQNGDRISFGDNQIFIVERIG